mgnify:CR=1 FL=1
MVGAEWTALQNGADIRGVASEGIIGEKVTLTSDKVSAIGRGFVQWLWQRLGKHPLRIALGTDCRITGPHFILDLEQAITHMGCDVLHCGLTSTPSMLISTKLPEINADGAIMLTITGSHMSFNGNGMKFFTSGDGITPKNLEEIIHYASKPYIGKEKIGQSHITNLQAIYTMGLRRMISDALESPDGKPLSGLKIIVDAGNGTGAFYVHRVLRPLGADVSASQFLTPDGRFPNHVPDPDNYEAMRSIATSVLYNHADLGILFDSDLDRVAFVDSEGRNINRNELVAMASAIVLEEHPNTAIVTDSTTSTGLSKFITNILSGKHYRYQRGYQNVIKEAKRLNNSGTECWLAIETSGHAAFRENAFVDDAAYFATKIVVRLAQLKRQNKPLFTLIEKLPVPQESEEYRLPINDNDFNRIASETLIAMRQYVSHIPGWEETTQNYDGLRVVCSNDYEQGWFIIRQSLHDAVMPINVESDIKGGTDAILKKLRLFFRNIHGIDSTQLYQ